MRQRTRALRVGPGPGGIVTRRHVEAIAEAFAETRPVPVSLSDGRPAGRDYGVWARDVAAIGAVLADSNPLFDWARFVAVCES